MEGKRLVSKDNNRRLGILFQYLQMGLSIIISFIYTPIMLNILGTSEYGVYNLANSIISYLSLLSLGFGASYIRFYSKYKIDDDSNAVKRLNGLYLMVFCFIGVIAFICGWILSNNVSIVFNDTYTDDNKKIAEILMKIMAFNLAWSFPASVFSSYVISQERFVFQKILNMMKSVLGPFLTLPFLLLGYGSIGMVLITTMVTLVADFINIFYCIQKLNMRFSFEKFDFKLLKEIFNFSLFIALNQVIDQVNWATDKVILGKVCGSAMVAYYSIGAQINTYFTQFSTAISSVYVPEIHRIEMLKITDVEKNEKHTYVFTKVGRVQFILLTLILTGFILFGPFFISIWAGEEYTSSYYVALLLMFPALIPLIQNIGVEVQRAKNKHQFRSIVYLCMALINVIISVIFAKFWGDIGAALGTTLSLIFANGIIMNVFYHKVIGINIIHFWKQIMQMLPCVLMPFVIMAVICYMFKVDTLVKFLIGVVIYVCIYFFFVFFWGMNREEKDIVGKFLKKFVKKEMKND